MNKKNQNLEYYEIDLMDYVKVIFKRKKWLFSIFLLAIAGAFVLTANSPETYQTRAVLRIGQVRGEKLENPQEAMIVLKQPSTLKEISKDINFENFEERPENEAGVVDGLLDVKNPEKSNLVVITAEDGSPQLAYEGAQAAANLVTERHNKLFEEKIKSIEERITIYQKEVDQLKEQIEQFRGRNYSEGQGLALQGYLDSLRSSRNKLNNLRLKKTNSKNTEIVAEPTIPESPEGPRLRLNLAIAGVLGIFIGIFWAFVLEWWEENKDKLKS